MAKPDATHELEKLIDSCGLLHVVTGLSLVCAEKSEHVQVNWQDDKTAVAWDKASQILEMAARKLPENL